MERDEIYLIEAWRMLLREWQWFAAALAFALLTTFALTHLLKRQWQATAWLQIGQVGVVPSGQDPKVEPLARVMERLKLVPFENEILRGAGFSPDAPQSKLYRSSLELDPLPYAGPLIRLSLRAESPQLARRLAEATVARLGDVHLKLEAAPLSQARQRLAQVQNDLRDAIASRDGLLKSATARGANRQGDDSGVVLESVLLDNNQQDIRRLQETRDDLAARLSSTYTYRTSLMWPVYVPKNSSSPNSPLLWAIGLVVGLGLGTFAAVARNAWRRRAVQSAHAPAAASA
ncbi:MAG: Wzz/FepE/Etk N-terminal domain-containing protein [Rhodanobacteraceae bacterium]